MEDETPDLSPAPAEGGRKPRLALMGEFSAGKSTLTNLLLGCEPLPTRVTATRLPPVWIRHGDDSAVAVRHDGSETPLDLDRIEEVDLSETRLIRMSLPSETLEICDLIDMPGISDPNMAPEVWQNVIAEADCVVWCTHATQAWRQSEAATWESIRDLTNGDNILIVTQFDKLHSDRDRARVMSRVRKETDGQFQAIYPVSLLQALEAGEDQDAWQDSGAAEFTEHLVEMLLNPSEFRATDQKQPVHPTPAPMPTATALEEPDEATPLAATAGTVVPKRVKAREGGSARPRPSASESRAGLGRDF